MSGITVNGVDLFTFLKIGQVPDAEIERRNEIRVRSYKGHVGIGHVAQVYDMRPGLPKLTHGKELNKLTLEEDRKKIMAELEAEAETPEPTFKKMMVGIMAMGEYLTANQITDKINSMTKTPKKLPLNSVSARLASLVSQKVQLLKVMERVRMSGSYHYRLFPSCAKFTLFELGELTKKYASFSVNDAIKREPSLKEEIEAGNPIQKLRHVNVIETKSKKNNQEVTDDAKTETVDINSEETLEKSPKKEAFLDEQDLEIPIESSKIEFPSIGKKAADMKVTINVNFGPIRILFGFDGG